MTKESASKNFHITKTKWVITQIVQVLLVITVLFLGIYVFQIESSDSNVLRAERLEIVEPDGNYSLVLANSHNLPLAKFDGEILDPDQDRDSPGMIFYDGQGDEVGALMMLNRKFSEDEEVELDYYASRHLSFDGFKQDQTIVIHHYEADESHSSGIRILDQPYHRERIEKLNLDDGATKKEIIGALQESDEITQQELRGHIWRATFGTDLDNNAALNLHDGDGQKRISIKVSNDGDAYIQFLDDEGNITNQLP